jgi:GNAT superfamily N-acetyltransferase
MAARTLGDCSSRGAKLGWAFVAASGEWRLCLRPRSLAVRGRSESDGRARFDSSRLGPAFFPWTRPVRVAWPPGRGEDDFMSLVFGRATIGDADAIAALRMTTARDLAQRHGAGPWTFACDSQASVQAEMRSSTLLLAREAGQVMASARLATRNPWLGPTEFFSPCDRPIYLTSMVVAPSRQHQGIGRQLIEEAKRVAIQLGGVALRLDTYQGPAGAGDFYRACGFREVHRGDYNATPLVWFEHVLQPGEGNQATNAR